MHVISLLFDTLNSARCHTKVVSKHAMAIRNGDKGKAIINSWKCVNKLIKELNVINNEMVNLASQCVDRYRQQVRNMQKKYNKLKHDSQNHVSIS